MILERILIKRTSYGANEGQYEAAISYNNEAGSIKLNLSPELSTELLKCCGKAIKKFSKDAAAELDRNIISSIREAKP